ncbi:hypothetical protein AB0C27_20860 [Nonomuraea sp. NPDC048882]|uniref:hypothetical protein n=1 Tax=Nonomuraea sp. NPDC048882 TaxID=3154347 RepID=UPI0033CF3BD0
MTERTERTDWAGLRDRRLSEPGTAEAYDAARLAFELDRAVRQMRLNELEEAAADLRDPALVLARSVTDTGERVSFDEVLAAFGQTRESLSAIPDDE